MKDKADDLIGLIAAAFVLYVVTFVVFLLVTPVDPPKQKVTPQEPVKERRVTKIVRWLWSKE